MHLCKKTAFQEEGSHRVYADVCVCVCVVENAESEVERGAI